MGARPEKPVKSTVLDFKNVPPAGGCGTERRRFTLENSKMELLFALKKELLRLQKIDEMSCLLYTSRVPRDEVKLALASYYGVTIQELFFKP